ncbi:hypothetical protein NUW54_g14705 [Trametes sanguinea]|uniref:Uncharacterized protein n=1 Tax=Trametes sanguinea TaxID=158606 RepID=A0ACC1MAP3_9APHY|nr:hypothetical protein NUW54_g14705 [Trametes sanguinea]
MDPTVELPASLSHSRASTSGSAGPGAVSPPSIHANTDSPLAAAGVDAKGSGDNGGPSSHVAPNPPAEQPAPSSTPASDPLGVAMW